MTIPMAIQNDWWLGSVGDTVIQICRFQTSTFWLGNILHNKPR